MLSVLLPSRVPGYPGSYYHHAPQGAAGTAYPAAYGSRAPASPWVQPGLQMGYDSQTFQQPPVGPGQSPHVPLYSPHLANEPDPPYPLGFARQQGSGPMTPPWSRPGMPVGYDTSPPLDQMGFVQLANRPSSPTSKQSDYSMAYTTHIHDLDDDSLLLMFSCYRLEDNDD